LTSGCIWVTEKSKCSHLRAQLCNKDHRGACIYIRPCPPPPPIGMFADLYFRMPYSMYFQNVLVCQLNSAGIRIGVHFQRWPPNITKIIISIKLKMLETSLWCLSMVTTGVTQWKMAAIPAEFSWQTSRF
jgi:hypothetical protein